MLIIALLAAEEEKEEHVYKIRRQKVRRRIWVEECWQERCIFGEFQTLCKILPSKGLLFYDYYKMDYEKYYSICRYFGLKIQKKSRSPSETSLFFKVRVRRANSQIRKHVVGFEPPPTGPSH